MNLVLLVSLTFGAVTVPEAWAANLYVATTGSDAGPNNCQTLATPCRTITHALTQASATDVVNVAAGTYDTPNNVETFPLALVDGVAIIGDLTWSLPGDPPDRTISAPAGTDVFFNDGTSALSSSTRLAGFTLTHDASSNNSIVLDFAVAGQAMSPRIDHNYFPSSLTYDEIGIFAYDNSTSAGAFSPTIDNNTFTDMWAPIWVSVSSFGGADTYSPTITANTFTSCDWPINYSMFTSAEGTVGGTVSGNVSTGTGSADIWVGFYPDDTGGLLFNPTITGNTFSSTSDNVSVSVGFSSHLGNVAFTPTISNNSLTATGGSNINVTTFAVSGGTGNVTFAPTISDNTTMSAAASNVYLFGYYFGVDGDVSVSPTITGNTMSGAQSSAISMSLTTLSVSTASQQNIVSPTIVGNTITSPGDTGVFIYLSGLDNGHFVSDMTISGNTMTSPGSDGILVSVAYFSDGTGLDWNLTISNNTISDAGGDGIWLSESTMSYSGTGTFDFTVEGNTITNPAGDGIGGYPVYSFYSSNATDVTVLLRGNTITGAGDYGIWLYFSDQTSNTLDARITDNVITGGSYDGLYLASHDLGSNGILVACNTITGNAGNGIYQEEQDDPPADYGGGDRSSPGNNVIYGNNTSASSYFDFENNDGTTAMAENNWWGDSDPSDQVSGPVDYTPALGSAPIVTLTVNLADALLTDVAPPGPTVGDTLLYTATITPAAGSCGDTALVFTAPIPANGTVVTGSATTTQGMIVSENPVTVNIGYASSGTAITVTWRVVANSGTQISSQGTLAATRSGSTLSNDPDTVPPSDPTVTIFQQQQSPDQIPTLSQWGLLLLAGLLLLLGAGLVRRRRIAAAGLAVLLALGAGWAGAAPPRDRDPKANKDNTLKASTVKSVAAAEKTVTLTLADGTSVTVPNHALKVKNLSTRPERPRFDNLFMADSLIEKTKLKVERDAAREQRRAERAAMPAEHRAQLREHKRLDRAQAKASKTHSRLDARELLEKGTPVVLSVQRDKDGTIKNARVEVYANQERARAEAERRLTRKADRERPHAKP